jgi:hypothetical protein
MENKIKMDFFVERASAQKYSSGFLIARGFIILLPLLYFTYIAYYYNYYTGAYYEADERITSLQEQIDRYQRELKNNKIVIIDSDTGETILNKGFFYDGETAFCDTVELLLDSGVREKVDKFKDGMAQGVKKIKTGERAIIDGLFAAASELGDEGSVRNLRLDFTLKRIDFQLSCQKRETLDKLISNLRARHWAEQVFVSSLKTSDGQFGAYIIISLKEAELFE